MALRWLQQKWSQTSIAQQAVHTSHSRTTYGLSAVVMLEKIDRVIMGPHCNNMDADDLRKKHLPYKPNIPGTSLFLHGKTLNTLNLIW